MRRSPQLLRVLQWTGLALSLFIITSWMVSLWWSFGYTIVDTSKPRQAPDTFFVGAYPVAFALELSQGCIRCLYNAPKLAQPGWHASRLLVGEIELLPRMNQPGDILVPFWMPFLCVALPTGFLWWCDRQIPPEHRQRWSYATYFGPVISFLVLVLWMVSLQWQVDYSWNVKPGQAHILGIHGGVMFSWNASFNTRNVGWSVQERPSGPVWFRFKADAPGYNCLPLWMPWLILVACIWILHRRTHPKKPDPACRNCGYSLTGNTSGICPECGRCLCDPIH